MHKEYKEWAQQMTLVALLLTDEQDQRGKLPILTVHTVFMKSQWLPGLQQSDRNKQKTFCACTVL